MLKAIRKDGTPFQLLPRHAKEVLRKEKSDNEFFCPECKEKVMKFCVDHPDDSRCKNLLAGYCKEHTDEDRCKTVNPLRSPAVPITETTSIGENTV